MRLDFSVLFQKYLILQEVVDHVVNTLFDTGLWWNLKKKVI